MSKDFIIGAWAAMGISILCNVIEATMIALGSSEQFAQNTLFTFSIIVIALLVLMLWKINKQSQ